MGATDTMNDVAIVKEGWLHKRGQSVLYRRSRVEPASAQLLDVGLGGSTDPAGNVVAISYRCV